MHQDDDHLVSGFSDIFAGLQVSGNLEYNLLSNLVVLKMYIKIPFRRFPSHEVSVFSEVFEVVETSETFWSSS